MPTTPTPVSAWATPPTRDDPANFRTRADAWNADLPGKSAELEALAANTYDNAVEGAASATASADSAVAAQASQGAAASSASLAASNAGAALWISGTTYAIGDVRRSPVDFRVYARRTPGAGAADPSADTANWQLVAVGQPQLLVSTATANALSVNVHIVLTNAAASTATLPATPAAGDAVWVTVGNGRIDNVIARNGKNIMGLAEDLTLDNPGATACLRYINTALGWRLV